MRTPPALVLATALLVGCLGQPAGDPSAAYGFDGVFLSTVGAAEILELGDRVRAEGGEFTVDDRIPPSFSAWGLTLKGCEVVREIAATMLFSIETIGPCEAAAITTNEPALMAAAVAAEPPTAR